MTTGRMIVTASLVTALAGTGCIFKSSTSQASFESSSKSSSSPFKWSSDSSSPAGDTPSAYQRDVTDYTAKFAASDGDVPSFQRDLSAIAEGHGVTGYVANLRDGRVLLVAEGPDRDVEEFLGDVADRLGGHIANEVMRWDSATGEFLSFDIRRA